MEFIIAGTLQSHKTVTISLVLLGLMQLFQGELARAYARLEESLSVSREMGYKRNIGLALYLLGMATFLQ